MARTINELVWHCSATPAGRPVTRDEIDRWHRERGWKSIGYHKVVHLDGSVSEGRPETQIGAHVAGRNAHTIGYCYVGGLNKDTLSPEDTRTKAQKDTMLRLTKEAIERYGLSIVSGHHDYAAKACPCFPAREEYASLLPNYKPPAPKPDSVVREIQERLHALGYGAKVGAIDGIMGSKTKAGIAAYEVAKGYAPFETPESLLRHLKASDIPAPPKPSPQPIPAEPVAPQEPPSVEAKPNSAGWIVLAATAVSGIVIAAWEWIVAVTGIVSPWW